jgi:single-stranded-DNA-specific exonuclease
MIFHKSRWQKNNETFKNSSELAEEFHLSEKIMTILMKRGIETKVDLERYLYPKIDDLYDPFLLKDMDKLVEALEKLKADNGHVTIYGDYDVDGITSISILYNYLKSEGYNVSYYIPNRFQEGYGLNSDALDRIKSTGATLVLTVDCGIASIAEAEHAKEIGLPLFVTDHHECQDQLPDCIGIVNPKQETCKYPFDMLVGAGIALKIVQALSKETFKDIYPAYMEIAAVGTIADIGPLVDENRIITKYGLKALENTRNLGLKALLEVVDLVGKELNSGHIGFGLGPRLNAAGRVESADLGVKLLTTTSLHEAETIAEELNTLNKQRQDMEQSIIDACIEQVETLGYKQDLILVLDGQGWHTGVIGIVASRISERYYKPCIILNVEDGIAKGSARSVGDFSIFEAMSNSKALFTKFGGHQAAAGVTMPSENVGRLRKEINEYGQTYMEQKDFYPRIKIDASVSSEDIAHDFAESLDGLKPFGLGNPKPCFLYAGLSVDTIRWLGKEKQHLKLSVHDGARVYECIKFNGSEEERKIRTGDAIDAVFTLDINKFRGVETLQFALKDIFVQNRVSSEFEEDFFVSFIDYLNGLEGGFRPYGGGKSIEALFEALDAHIASDDPFILSVGSISGLKAVEAHFIESGYEHYSWQFSHQSGNKHQIVVHPKQLDLDRSTAHLALDVLCGDHVVCHYDSHNQRNDYKVYKEKLTIQMSIFKFLYKELVALKEPKLLRDLGEEMKLAPYIVYLGARVFEEKGLMEISYKDGFLYVVNVHKPSQKVDLMSAKILQRIQGL